ncbi:MAG: class IIb bacteriocin, lactobin A/cerein 7B family [Bacilli bacterium]|jgi:lactobin A/cerein 7B family class IIb bacteriocin
MQQLSNRELMDISGGISVLGALAIVSAVVFIIGLIDGFVRPLKCRS